MGKVEGNEVARWERWESGEVGWWEVPDFIQGWRTRCVQDFIFLFLMLIKGTKGWVEYFFACLQGWKDTS